MEILIHDTVETVMDKVTRKSQKLCFCIFTKTYAYIYFTTCWKYM